MNEFDFGVVYYTDENPHYQRMLGASIASLKRFHPEWPIKVFTIPTPKSSLLRNMYRSLTPWKNVKRRQRCGQDMRTIARKTDIVLSSPFKNTLYLDVDTIVMNSLDSIKEWIEQYDLIITSLPWKSYQRTSEWQPETWPYVMAGVFAYNERFRNLYEKMVTRFGGSAGIAKLYNTDQYVLSLLCNLHKDDLRIKYWPDLQIDVVNIPQHLRGEEFRTIDGHCDIRSASLRRFHIFHYNDFKPAYMKQIREFWGYDL